MSEDFTLLYAHDPHVITYALRFHAVCRGRVPLFTTSSRGYTMPRTRPCTAPFVFMIHMINTKQMHTYLLGEDAHDAFNLLHEHLLNYESLHVAGADMIWTNVSSTMPCMDTSSCGNECCPTVPGNTLAMR